MNKHGWMAALLGAVVALAGCGGDKSKEAIATVEGEPITREEYYRQLETKPTVTVRIQGQTAEVPVSELLGYQALRDLVARKILLQEARDKGVEPNDKDITAELDFRQKIDPQYIRRQQSNGKSFDQIKSDIKFELAQERILTKDVKVSMDEVEQYIKDNPKEFIQPATAELRWVLVTKPEKRALVDAQLGQGKDFVSVATEFSEFANARRDQARFPGREVNMMPAKVRDAIVKTPENEMTGWIELEKNYARFFVERKTEERKMEMNEARKELVRRDLARRRGAVANDLAKRLEDRLVNGKIDIRLEQFKEAWKRSVEEVKAGRGKSDKDEAKPNRPAGE